jgi:hypothetical protein
MGSIAPLPKGRLSSKAVPEAQASAYPLGRIGQARTFASIPFYGTFESGL